MGCGGAEPGSTEWGWGEASWRPDVGHRQGSQGTDHWALGPPGAGQASDLSLGKGIIKPRGHVLIRQVLAVDLGQAAQPPEPQFPYL